MRSAFHNCLITFKFNLCGISFAEICVTPATEQMPNISQTYFFIHFRTSATLNIKVHLGKHFALIPLFPTLLLLSSLAISSQNYLNQLDALKFPLIEVPWGYGRIRACFSNNFLHSFSSNLSAISSKTFFKIAASIYRRTMIEGIGKVWDCCLFSRHIHAPGQN